MSYQTSSISINSNSFNNTILKASQHSSKYGESMKRIIVKQGPAQSIQKKDEKIDDKMTTFTHSLG